jgi:hypothetical protein
MVDFQAPLSSVLLEYWLSRQHPPAGIPSTEDFLDHLPPRIAPYMILFELKDEDLIVRFLGTQLVARWGEDLTGRNWSSYNPHIKGASLVSNLMTMNRHPCGAHALTSFVTNTNRQLSLETATFPLSVQPGRALRVISGSFALEALGFDERSRGWMPPRILRWVDLGFGTPEQPPKPP